MPKNLSSFDNRLLTGFVTSLLVVLAITLLSYQRLNNIRTEHLLANHTQEVTEAATTLLQQVTDAETAARGYFGTSQEVFITSFQQALSNIDPDYQVLLTAVQDDPVELHKVEQLSSHVEAKQTVMKSYVAQRRASGTTGSIPIERVMNGKSEMDMIRKLVADVVAHAQDNLKLQQQRSEQAIGNALVVLISGALLFTMMIFVLFLYIRRNFNRKTVAEQQLAESNTQLEQTLAENKHRNWMLQGLKHLAEEMQGQKNIDDLGAVILKELIDYTAGVAGTMYLYQQADGLLQFCAAHAVSPREAIRRQFRLTETWIGQVGSVQQPKLISGKINANLTLSTSIFEKELAHCFIVPFFYEKELYGVMELGYREEPTTTQKEFILSTLSRIGVNVHAMLAKTEIEALYASVQQQAEELQVQQQELRAANEELLIKNEIDASKKANL